MAQKRKLRDVDLLERLTNIPGIKADDIGSLRFKKTSHT